MSTMFVLLVLALSVGVISQPCELHVNPREVLISSNNVCYEIRVYPPVDYMVLDYDYDFSDPNCVITMSVNSLPTELTKLVRGNNIDVRVNCNSIFVLSYSGVFNDSHTSFLNDLKESNLHMTKTAKSKLHLKSRQSSEFNGTHFFIQNLLSGIVSDSMISPTSAVVDVDALYHNLVWTYFYLSNTGGFLYLNKIGSSVPLQSVKLSDTSPDQIYVRSTCVTLFGYGTGKIMNYGFDLQLLAEATLDLQNEQVLYPAPNMIAITSKWSYSLSVIVGYNPIQPGYPYPPGKVMLYPDPTSFANPIVLYPPLFPIPHVFGQVLAMCSETNTLLIGSRYVRAQYVSFENVVYVFKYLNSAHWGYTQILDFPELNQYPSIQADYISNIACDGNTLVVSFSELKFLFSYENSEYVKKFVKLGDSQHPLQSFSVSKYCNWCYMESCASCNWYCVDDMYFGNCQEEYTCPSNSHLLHGLCVCDDGFSQINTNVNPNHYCTRNNVDIIKYGTDYSTEKCVAGAIGSLKESISLEYLDSKTNSISTISISSPTFYPSIWLEHDYFYKFPSPVCSKFWRNPTGDSTTLISTFGNAPVFTSDNYLEFYEKFLSSTTDVMNFGYLMEGDDKTLVIAMDVANGRNEVNSKLLVLEKNGYWRAIDELTFKKRSVYDATNVIQTINFVSVQGSEMMIGVSLTCALFISPTTFFPCEDGLVYIYKKDKTQHWKFYTLVSSPLDQNPGSTCSTFGRLGVITPLKRYISLCNKICSFDKDYNLVNCGLDGFLDYTFLQSTSQFLYLANSGIYYHEINIEESLSFIGASFGDPSIFFATDEYIFVFSSWVLTIVDRAINEVIQQLYFYVMPADITCSNKDLLITDQNCNVHFYVFENNYFVLRAIIKPTLPFSISQANSQITLFQNLLLVSIPSLNKIFQIDIFCIKYGGCSEYCNRGTMEPFQCVPNNCSSVGECNYSSEQCTFNGTGFSCFCAFGYQKNFSGICDNINECSKSYFPPLHTCDKNQVCVDTPGSFMCRCADGLIESLGAKSNQQRTCVQDFTPLLMSTVNEKISSLLLWEDFLFISTDQTVQVHKFTKNKWEEYLSILSPIQDPNSNFGWAITTNGNYLAISDPQNSNMTSPGFVAVYNLTDLQAPPIIIPSIFNSTRIPFYLEYLNSVCPKSTELWQCPWNSNSTEDCLPDLNLTYFERYSRFGHSLALNRDNDLVITAYDGLNPGWIEVWHINSISSIDLKYYYTRSVQTNNGLMSSPCLPDTEYASLFGETLFSLTRSHYWNSTVESPDLWSISKPDLTTIEPQSYQLIRTIEPISSIDYYSNYVLIGSSSKRQAILLENSGDYWILLSTFQPPIEFPSGFFGQSVSFDKYDGDIYISDPYYNNVYLFRLHSTLNTYYLENLINGEKANTVNFGNSIASYGDKIAISNGMDIFFVLDCPTGILSSNTCNEFNSCALGTHNCQQICNFTDSNFIYTCDCYSGFQKDGTLCIDIDECTNGTHDCTHEYQNCKNMAGTYECVCDDGCIKRNGTCYALPCIMAKSPWTKCPENLCQVPSVYRTLNITRKTPNCPSVLSETVAYFDVDDASTALSHLLSEFFFKDYLKNQLKEIGANLISVLLSDHESAISINYNFTTYDNLKRSTPGCPNITNILLDATKIILPSILPSRILIWNDTYYSSQCSSVLKIEPLTPISLTTFTVIIASSLSGVFVIAILIAIPIIKRCFKNSDDYSILPEMVRKYYEYGRDYQTEWSVLENLPLVYMLKITKKDEYHEILQLFEKLDGASIEIQSIEAVYNPSLVEAFCNYRSILRARRENSRAVFDKKDWKQKPDVNIREFIYKSFLERVAQYPWNDEKELAPIIPVIHGTTRDLAIKIAQNGKKKKFLNN